MARIVLVLLALGAAYYLYQHSASAGSRTTDASSTAPIDRARRAAQQSRERDAAAEPARREAEAPSTGTVSENMTPDQVRALLGPPSDVQSETTDTGVRRETWTYAAAGKKVVFENGIAVSIR